MRDGRIEDAEARLALWDVAICTAWRRIPRASAALPLAGWSRKMSSCAKQDCRRITTVVEGDLDYAARSWSGDLQVARGGWVADSRGLLLGFCQPLSPPHHVRLL